jgi:hypothetical protein
MKRALTVAFLLLILGAATIPILWHAYDIRPFIDGGAYTREYALNRVMWFSSFITILMIPVWIWLTRTSTSQSGAKIFWKGAAYTLIVLVLYAFIVMQRRNSWRSSDGVNDWAMFYGDTNGFFFSEVGVLSFALEVMPAVSIISGMLLVLERLIARRAMKYSATPPNTQ